MNSTHARPRVVALTALALLTVCGCGATSGDIGSDAAARPGSPARTASPEPAGAGVAVPAPVRAAAGPAVHSTDPYVRLAGVLQEYGVQVWYETDLVKAWLAGPARFEAVMTRLRVLARSSHVTGWKIADELGYGDGLTSPGQARAFLSAARAALGKISPGAPVLVDVVVPDLGCLPWRSAIGARCAERARSRYPAASSTAVTSYLKAGLIDRLDLSSGLLDSWTYAGMGTTRIDAQRDAWSHVRAAGWGRLTGLQARKALAAPGGYQGRAGDAASDVDIYLDVPVTAGARAVDVWTWRQPYSGSTVSLLPPDLRSNVLWQELRQERSHGVSLFTHMTPSAMPGNRAGIERECAVAAEVFTSVFVAAGTG